VTPRQAQLIRDLALDQSDWNHAMWGLANEGYEPAEIKEALEALDRLAGDEPRESTLDDYTPR